MTENNPEPKYIDDLNCREIYAETVQVIVDSGGLLRIELCVNRWTHQTPVRLDRITPVARFAIPVGLAVVLRDRLNGMIELLQKAQRGQVAPPSETKQ